MQEAACVCCNFNFGHFLYLAFMVDGYYSVSSSGEALQILIKHAEHRCTTRNF